ncbi:MAG: SpoIIE family protein phosphatase [Opitutales bacterium]|nr:SpoIIE family protein phosphatase [Opitutales bacterium]
MHKSTSVLLVDDQPIIGEAVRRMLSGQDDIEFHFCQDPTKAMSEAESVAPTVILQDLVMPDVDGLTLVKFFRANPKTRDIPLVVLSSKEEPDTKYRAFENGANDYMVKFPDALEVLARIRYHSRAYTALLERNDAMRRLQESQNALKNELDEADHYVRSLLPAKIPDGKISADWIFKTSTSLGGDCFGYGAIDGRHFAAYLLDVCGHGVGAALLSVSATNVLRSHSLSGVDFTKPDQVLASLNNAFDMDRQNGMYFTLWYGVYDTQTRELSYASGGHPPAILVSNGEYQKLKTGGIVIGGMPDAKFECKTVSVPENSKLYIFSDGVYEVDYADGSGMMSVDDFAAELAKPAPEGVSKAEAMLRFSQNAQ